MLPDIPVHVMEFPPSATDRPPPLPPQMPLQQQQSIGSIRSPPLTEERFMDLFMLFSHATGLRLNEQDFNIEGHQVNPWDLHRMVFALDGFDLVTTNDAWPVVGAALGFPTLFSDSKRSPTGGQLPVCSPAVALRLQQLYQATLRLFDQAYISSTQARNLQTSGQAPPQPPRQQAELPQPTGADLETLLADVLPVQVSEAPSEVTRLLPQPQFPGTPGPELGIVGAPQHTVAFVEQNQRSAQDQNGVYAGPGTRSENAQPANIAWLCQAPGNQGPSRPSVQSIPNYQQQLPPQQVLRARALQGGTTQQQDRQRMMQTPPHHTGIQVLPEQGFPQQMGNQNSPLQLLQFQDPLQAHPFTLLLPQGQQQHNGPGFTSRMGQNLNHSGMGHPQGQASLQRNFVQNPLSVPPEDIQFASTTSISQAHPPPGQQVPTPSTNFADLPLPQLRGIYAQMIRTWMEGEKGLQVSSTSGGEGDIQRQQQLCFKLITYKHRVLALRELINTKATAIGDLSQLVNGPPWLDQAQRPAGLYPASERFGQHISHSLEPASVNQATQRDGPILQQNPLATAQSNFTQISSRLPANNLPQRPQAIQTHNIPPLPEDRFKHVFMQFTASTGFRLTERGLLVEDRPVNLWALHRAVFMRNGFESVCTNDEWPFIGIALGFPAFSGGDDDQPARCTPVVVHRLQQLYNDVLRQFDQSYISSVVHRIKASSQMDPRSYQPTEVDYQALLASISSESSIMTPETMGILPRFSDACVAELAANRLPEHIIAFVEHNRGHLKRAAQDQNGYRASLIAIATRNTTFNNRTQVNRLSALPTMAYPPLGYQELRSLQSQTMVQGTMAYPHVQSSRAQPISDIPLKGGQIRTSSGEAQNQGGVMSKPMDPGGVDSVTSSPIIYHSAGPIQIRKPTPEEVIAAKRWVDEQKKIAFSREFDGVADNFGVTIPESEIQEYRRNLERLDQVLSNIEKYIHIAFAALKKEDVVERMFFMMASTRAQLEKLKNPKPRHVLELHIIRGMIQEADNMDKGLKIVLGFRLPTPLPPVPPGRIPSVPQPPPRPLSMGIPRPIAQPTTPAAVQWDESISSPEEATSDGEGLFDEEVRIAMDKLRI